MNAGPLGVAATQLTERIQQALHDRGFYAGAVDGIAGPATSEAIRAFEQRLGVAATGDVNERVLALLKSERGRLANARQPAAGLPVAGPPAAPKPTLASAPTAPKQALQLMPAPVPPEPLTGSAEGRLQRVQKALNVAGYGPLPVDGRLDDRTAAAIRQFETEHGLPVTGRLSERLVSMLVVKSASAN
jgi:peptidoglycan hydrolase-like protein with peptidoglycan-binding domain